MLGYIRDRKLDDCPMSEWRKSLSQAVNVKTSSVNDARLLVRSRVKTDPKVHGIWYRTE